MWGVFKFTNKKGNNNVEITAPSKTAAGNMVKMMMQNGGGDLRFDSQRPETDSEMQTRLVRRKKKEIEDQERRARQPRILRRRKAFGRNDRCPCGATKPDGSPKKVKHCCGRKGLDGPT